MNHLMDYHWLSESMNLLNQLLFSALEYASFIYLFASALSILLPAWGGSGGGGGGVVRITHRFMMMHCHIKFGYKRLVGKDEITEMTTVCAHTCIMHELAAPYVHLNIQV